MKKLFYLMLVSFFVIFLCEKSALAGPVTITGTATWERVHGMQIGTFRSDKGKKYTIDLDSAPSEFRECIQNSPKKGKLKISVSLDGDNVDFSEKATCSRVQ